MRENILPSQIFTYLLILIVTLFTLYISFQITANDYKDNKRYSQAYFLMNKHYMYVPNKGIDTNNMYYLVDSPRFSRCNEDGQIKYYLLDKTRYTINNKDSILTDKQYNLLSCEKLSKYDLGIVKQEKGYYIQKDRTLNELMNSYRTTIGGIEPTYIIISYILSSMIDYNYFILLINLIFLLVVYLALKKFTKHYNYMFILLVLLDYYFYMYLSSVHRLKLAIIFLLLSYITYNKTKIVMIVSALFSHLQIIIFYLYYLILTQIQNNRLEDILSKKKKYDIYMVLTLALFAFALGFVSREILSKISYYLHIEIPYKVLALVFVYLIYLYIFKLKETMRFFIPLAIIVIGISFLIGSSRVNLMLMEFILIVELNRALNKNKYALLIVIPFILYSGYKSINYIQLGLQ